MKEIKAYIRPDALGVVLGRLEEAGAKVTTVNGVEAIGGMADAEKDCVRFLRKHDAAYADAVKLEIVCGDIEVEPFIKIILETAHTGKIGDGRILVSNIERLVNIRTGAEGEGAL